jgi:hypothetical protein
MNASRLVAFLALGTLAAAAMPTRAQQDQGAPSVAEAARRARDKKAQASAHAKQVWDNESIPTTPHTISVIGQGTESATPSGEAQAAPDKPADAGAAPAAAPEAKPAASDADKAQERAAAEAALARAREQLEGIKKDYDLMERAYVLDQQTYYGKPGYASDKEGKDHLDAEERDLAAKREEVKQAEQKVQQLEQQVKPAGEKPAVPPSS